MDALSAALQSVQMTGAVFFDMTCAAPWGFTTPPMEKVAHILAPGTEKIACFHLVTEGEALVTMKGERDVVATAGDIVIVPHGDPHTLSNGKPSALINIEAAVSQILAGDLTPWRFGDGGAVTRFVCGFFGCEKRAADLFISGLPRIIKLNLAGDEAGKWVETSMRHLREEAASGRPGREMLLAKMAEALFIESLRRYTAQMPDDETGWLAGSRDRVVGRALALMHGAPARPWSSRELAAETGASRTVVEERFRRYLGMSPLAYLTHWRLQLAAKLLKTTNASVVEVGLDVGYESEAAFNRAFKRAHGAPPARYRRQAAPDGVASRPRAARHSQRAVYARRDRQGRI